MILDELRRRKTRKNANATMRSVVLDPGVIRFFRIVIHVLTGGAANPRRHRPAGRPNSASPILHNPIPFYSFPFPFRALHPSGSPVQRRALTRALDRSPDAAQFPSSSKQIT
jgi:hypothetical protein